MRIVGIDPGNALSGISYWEDGYLIGSEVLNPWVDAVRPPDSFLMRTIHATFVEVSAHGTHRTREGIQWAGGMVVAHLMGSGLGIVRDRVVKVKPKVWRHGLGLTTGEPKEYYVSEARAYAPEVEDDNEAEAILIGCYGCLMKEKKA